MLIRIVKLTFHHEHVPAFLANFELMKARIRNAPGNRLLELYRDKADEGVFFTYSVWETEQDLQNYRNSELFCNVWSFTKKLFREKPEAWSVDKLVSLGSLQNLEIWKWNKPLASTLDLEH